MRVVHGKLTGHIDRKALEVELGRVEALLTASPAALLLDCRSMDGYELDARHAFVEMTSRLGARLPKIAILTDRQLWLMVISAMSVASGVAMKGFSKEPDAMAWLAQH